MRSQAIIERGIQTYLEVGAALREIRDSRLYKKNYSSFEEYCRTRWGWGDRKVNEDIQALEYVERQRERGHADIFTKTQALTAARAERRQSHRTQKIDRPRSVAEEGADMYTLEQVKEITRAVLHHYEELGLEYDGASIDPHDDCTYDEETGRECSVCEEMFEAAYSENEEARFEQAFSEAVGK